MALTESKCRTAKAAGKQIKLSDGGGLALLVMPNGTKSWVHRYSFEGRQRDDTLGRYPDIGLAEARHLRDRARLVLHDGGDPREHGDRPEGRAQSKRKSAKAIAQAGRSRLFRNVAEEWMETRYRPINSPQTAKERWACIQNHLLPHIGDMDVGEITIKDMLRALQACTRPFTARRARGLASEIFDYAEIAYDVQVNPAPQKLLRHLTPVPPERHHPALPFDQLPEFYVRLRGEKCLQARDDHRTRLAVELVMHTVLRTKELRFGRFDQIVGAEWHLPAEAMKKVGGTQHPHIVPLSARAQEIIRELRDMAGRRQAFMFPGLRPGHVMSENTMNFWMKARGYDGIAVPHGFRTMFSTHANESGLWHPDWIEMQLAHVERNKVRGAYNKARYLDHRRRMMDWWGKELEAQERKGLLVDDLADLIG